MNPAAIIAKKRDAQQLSANEIAAMLRGYVRGDVPDYQMAAFSMAIYLNGMSSAETAALTLEMLQSGVTLAWSSSLRPIVDKHSTGGVGDKVSLVLAPLLACCELRVPMISGRGLGPTGGTLDKLEAIPGFRTDLNTDEISAITARVGCVITGATNDLAPADRKLYALRDVTATVASIPLITASIMSKKLAEGLDALVLDVKFGSGAFMKTLDNARQLAQSLVETGAQVGVKTTALLTDMNQPLGAMVGNAVEVDEAVAALSGEGPQDLVELTVALGSQLLLATRRTASVEEGRQVLLRQLDAGAGLRKLDEMVTAQGGNLDLPRPIARSMEVIATSSGFLASIDTESLGQMVIELGGGRRVLTDRIDHSVGLEILVRIGDRVTCGQPLLRVFAPTQAAEQVHSQLSNAFTISEQPTEPRILVRDCVDSN